jgi:hypothetical protein
MLSNITTWLFHGIVVGYIKNKMLNNLTSQYNPHVKPHMFTHNNNITVDRNLRPSMALVCSSVIIS